MARVGKVGVATGGRGLQRGGAPSDFPPPPPFSIVTPLPLSPVLDNDPDPFSGLGRGLRGGVSGAVAHRADFASVPPPLTLFFPLAFAQAESGEGLPVLSSSRTERAGGGKEYFRFFCARWLFFFF